MGQNPSNATFLGNKNVKLYTRVEQVFYNTEPQRAEKATSGAKNGTKYAIKSEKDGTRQNN